ncbi:MAG: hypothetical protein ACYTFG_00240 [Planctomycetota bacterium]
MHTAIVLQGYYTNVLQRSGSGSMDQVYSTSFSGFSGNRTAGPMERFEESTSCSGSLPGPDESDSFHDVSFSGTTFPKVKPGVTEHLYSCSYHGSR